MCYVYHVNAIFVMIIQSTVDERTRHTHGHDLYTDHGKS